MRAVSGFGASASPSHQAQASGLPLGSGNPPDEPSASCRRFLGEAFAWHEVIGFGEVKGG